MAQTIALAGVILRQIRYPASVCIAALIATLSGLGLDMVSRRKSNIIPIDSKTDAIEANIDKRAVAEQFSKEFMCEVRYK